jgi:hypothetical protein
MVPLAPLKVSTTTGWPSGPCIASAMIRASVSVGPPGGNPTIMVTGRDGKISAAAGAATAASASSAAAKLAMRFGFMTSVDYRPAGPSFRRAETGTETCTMTRLAAVEKVSNSVVV